MGNLDGFDASEVEPVSYEPIPAGEYVAVISDSEFKDTRSENGEGRGLKLVLVIVEGEHEGRKLWPWLQLEHTNPKAAQIGKGQLSAICRAVGVLTPRDSSELHDIPFVVNVKIVRDKKSGDLKNSISGYAPVPTEEASKPTSKTAPPWKRG